jgi:hypothetical protein
VGTAADSSLSRFSPSRGRLTRAIWHTVGLIVATLLAYAVWRGYQNPDLLLELSAFRLC